MFETVHAIAAVAPHTRVQRGIDECLAFCVVALARSLQCRLARTGKVTCWSTDFVEPSLARPFTCFGTRVGGFGTVVKAISAMAGVAAERKEVKLVTVGALTVGADSLDVGGVEHCEGLVWG